MCLPSGIGHDKQIISSNLRLLESMCASKHTCDATVEAGPGPCGNLLFSGLTLYDWSRAKGANSGCEQNQLRLRKSSTDGFNGSNIWLYSIVDPTVNLDSVQVRLRLLQHTARKSSASET